MFLRRSSSTPVNVPEIPGNVGLLFKDLAGSTQQRRLTATIGVVRVVLDCGNREILRVIEVAPADFPGAEAAAIATRDDDDLPNQLATLGRLFANLAALSGQIDIQSASTPLRYSNKLQGFSREDLALATITEISKTVVVPKPQPQPQPQPRAPDPQPAKPKSEGVELPAEIDRRFYDHFRNDAEAAVMFGADGSVLVRNGRAEWFADHGMGMIQDVRTWLSTTTPILSQRQILLLRGQSASDPALGILIDTHAITVLALPASITGRLFTFASGLGL